ncbi:MAG: ATP-binding protein, partial [Anaerolineae bacterium]
AVFANWRGKRQLLLTAFAGILVAALLEFLTPGWQLQLSGRFITIPSLVIHLFWAGLSAFILISVWRSFWRTTFPWHANRLLFWFLALAIVFIGDALTIFQWSGLTIAGQFVRLFGFTALVYGIASYRIFDVRTRSQRVLTFVTITLVTSLPLTGIILLAENLTGSQSVSARIFITIAAATVSFLLYQPFRRLVSRLLYRFFLDEGINTGQVVRNYSQAAYKSLDVQQLALVIITTIRGLLKANKSALMIVSKVEDGFVIEPISVMGHTHGSAFHIPSASLFIKTLTQQHQPLSKYDIDFNPEYGRIPTETRQWFNELGMDVYVPVTTGDELDGIITIGPKQTGVPYQPGELELLQILADQTVIALQNARLYSELDSQNDKIRHLNVDLVQQNERLEIMDRVKSDFITIASHELRTPLTQVKGYADILDAFNEDNTLNQKQTREIVGHIDRATKRLEGLITAMLDASQLDAAGMELKFVQTTLDTIIRMASEPLTQALLERRITMTTGDIATLTPFYADFKRLVQAFSNIIGNAIKYTPDHGSIAIDADLTSAINDSEEFLEVVISDTGIGIDAQYHELIFEKFFRIGDPQLHSTGSTKFKGAGPGLGLPIAKGVIEAHGGRTWVESEGEDEERLPGSQFHIVLPVRPPGLEHQLANPAQPKKRPAWLVG